MAKSLAQQVISACEALTQDTAPGASLPLGSQLGNGNSGRGQGFQSYVWGPSTPDGRSEVPQDGSGYYHLLLGPNNLAEVGYGPYMTFIEAQATGTVGANMLIGYFDASTKHWFVFEGNEAIPTDYNVINRMNKSIPQIEYGPTPADAVPSTQGAGASAFESLQESNVGSVPHYKEWLAKQTDGEVTAAPIEYYAKEHSLSDEDARELSGKIDADGSKTFD